MKYRLLLSLILLALTACSRNAQEERLYATTGIRPDPPMLPCRVVSSHRIALPDSRVESTTTGVLSGIKGTQETTDNPRVSVMGAVLGGLHGARARPDQQAGVEYRVRLREGGEALVRQVLRSGDPILEAGDACRLLYEDPPRVLPAEGNR